MFSHELGVEIKEGNLDRGEPRPVIIKFARYAVTK